MQCWTELLQHSSVVHKNGKSQLRSSFSNLTTLLHDITQAATIQAASSTELLYMGHFYAWFLHSLA